MSQQQPPNQQLIQFILRAQQIALKDGHAEQGYGMVLISIVSVVLFSLLAAALTITNLSKLSTDAYVDGNNSFYIAESGLNQRADQLRQKFIGYDLPTGLSPGQATRTSPVTLSNISNCFSAPVTTATSVVSSDFECRNYAFRYNNNAAEVRDSSGNIVLGSQDNNRNSSNYIAHTFVADRTNYQDPSDPTLGPQPTRILSGQAYAGLNAQEYVYTVYSTAKKPNLVESNALASFTADEVAAKNRTVEIAGDDALIASYDTKAAAAAATNAGRAANNSNINAVLQMDFRIRAIPLFQFGAFYNNDLDISPFSRMDIFGRVHTNKTLIINSNDGNGLHFAGPNAGITNDSLNYSITAVGDIYTKDLASKGSSGGINYIIMPGGTENIIFPDGRVATANKLANYKDTPLNNNPSAPADYKLDNFKPYLLNYLSSTPVQTLKLPPLGFLRRTDSTGEIGDYYGKADLRLTMRFDRAIPFDLTTIKTGASDGATCTTSLNIPANRMGKATAECSSLSKGKLKSLMQPVLVLAKDNTDERNRFCRQSIPVRKEDDSTIVNYNLNNIDSITPNSTLNSLNATNKDKILRALQVAIAAAGNRVSYEDVTTTGVLPNAIRTTFKSLLDRLKAANSGDTALQTALSNTGTIAALPPATIAATRSSCFLPAPIQKLDTTGSNPYDLREDRAMKLLQTHLESLTVWNRDGVYVNFDTNLNTAGTATTTDIEAAFDDVITTTPVTYSTNNLLFVRAEVSTDIASNYQKLGYAILPAQSFQRLGLGAIDRTEGGLVLHAILDDTDFPIDSADNKRKYGTDSANNYLKSQSRFGLVVSGGKNLPGPLTIASDQAVYTQGDYNTFGYVNITNIGANQPASILADTITVLSNSCMSGGTGTTISGVGSQTDKFLRGQINCMFNDTRAGRTNSTVNGQSRKATPTAVYAAFASNNEASCGNSGSSADAAYCTNRNARTNTDTTFRSAEPKYFSGAFHNYPRMLEQWTVNALGVKVRFTYRGSMVNLGLPQEFNGLQVWDNVYDMPDRNWGFDLLFNSFDRLPPLTPRVVYLKQDVFKRSY